MHTKTKLILIGLAVGGVFIGARSAMLKVTKPAQQIADPVAVEPVEVAEPVETKHESARYPSIEAYFKAKNPNPITHRQGLPRYERDVSNRLRNEILERDGHCCVVCGSRKQPEVDHHGRGLQNNGSNEPENLAVLRHECHVAKTRMDNSVRRQRDKRDKESRR